MNEDDPGREAPRETPRSDLPVGRAAFLGMVAAGVGAIFIAPSISGRVNTAVSSIVPDSITSTLSGGGWRIYNVAPPMPTFHPESYALRIGGLVRRPRTLGWSQVAAMPGDQQVSDFHCVTGWTVPKVHWEGIRPAAVVDLVEPLPRARYVTFFSLEAPYVDQISLDQFLVEDVLVARHMDGRPLALRVVASLAPGAGAATGPLQRRSEDQLGHRGRADGGHVRHRRAAPAR